MSQNRISDITNTDITYPWIYPWISISTASLSISDL